MTIVPIKKKSIYRIVAFYQLSSAAFKVLLFGETTLVFIDENDTIPKQVLKNFADVGGISAAYKRREVYEKYRKKGRYERPT